MKVRTGRESDDAALLQLMSQVVMPGSIGLSYCYENSFYGALEAQGYDPRTIVAEKCGAVVAAGTVTKRKVYLRGIPTEVGYLASLRIAPHARGSLLLPRGYRLLKELQEHELQLPFYLTSIMRSNTAALSLLTSGRAGLPAYHLAGGYKTAVIPILRNLTRVREYSFFDGGTPDSEHILFCLENYGRSRDFFTVYDRAELSQGKGMLKGIRPEDFIVAFRGSEPVGVVALWDHSSFRKMVVRSYSGGLGLAATLDRVIGNVTGAPFLPRPQEPFAPRYLSCVAVQNNDPEIFESLLAEALRRMRERREKLLIAGFFEEDRLCAVLNSFFHIPFYSNIYSVDWNGGSAIPSFRDCYLDAGSL